MTNEPINNLPAVVTHDRETLLALAREVAMGIHDIEDILAKRGLSLDQYAVILKNPFFARVLEGETIAWHSAANTPERIKIEAAAMLELFLPELNSRLWDREGSTLPAIVEGGKFVAKIAGVGERVEGGGHAGERFVIQINLGGGKSVEKEVTGPVIEGVANADT